MKIPNVLKWPALALLMGVAACGDSGVEPKAAPTEAAGALIGTKLAHLGDTTVTQFTIDPSTSTWFTVGDSHGLYIPARAVCDLETSSYGPTEWDRPCTAMRKNLVITAKSWKNTAGRPQVDFSPSLRFNPKAGQVTLFLAVNAQSQLDRNPNIFYCAVAGAVCVDELLTDRSLATYVDEANGYAYRRIKHFSGYSLSTGRAGGGSLDY
jgi:hypothetical protein